MRDGSSNAARLSHPALPPIPVSSGRLLPITERDQFHLSVDRDHEAGGETEVEPDSVRQLSLSSRHARGAGTARGVSRARERARYLLSAGAGGECTEDEGISGTGINGNGADEVDEVEMGDTIERRFPFLFKCPYQILFASTFHSLPLQVIPYTDTPKLSITDTMAQKKTQRWTKNMATLVLL